MPIQILRASRIIITCWLALGQLAACAPAPAVTDALTLLREERFDAALERARRALASDPDNTQLWKIVIHVHLARDRVPQAVEAYQRRVRQNKGQEDRALLAHLSLTLLRWGLQHRDPATRLEALHQVRRVDAEPLLEDVIRRLSDPDPLVRTWAAVAVSWSPAGAETLQEQIDSGPPPARAVALEQLGRVAKKKALATLRQHLADPSPEVRTAVARGLAHGGPAEALPLLQKLMADPERLVRAAAAAAAGQLGLADAAPGLTKMLRQDPYKGARVAAARALCRLPPGLARPALGPVARDRQQLPLALVAGACLARHGESQPVLNAIAMGISDTRWTVRVAACNTARSVKQRVALELLLPALRDPEPRVRLAAARALQDRPADVTRPALALRALTCGPRGPASLCLQAAELLHQLGNGLGLRTLGQLARKAQQPASRDQALQAALRAGAPRSLAVEALADSSPRVLLGAAAWTYRALRD